MILHFLGAKIAVPGAFVLEGLAKLINLVGAFNRGNFGTYEGGNMLITNLFVISAIMGLTLGAVPACARFVLGSHWRRLSALHTRSCGSLA